MTLLSWIAIGLVVGTGWRLVARRYGLLEDAIVGVVGAVVFGWLFVLFTGASVVAVDPEGLLFSLLGSTLSVALARGISRGRATI
ncbi:MAG TPA: hypothetical protein VHS06_09005 [Chloroflexota bacterium]|nr:hypothetical protein [Chloroflexota bacterium]